MAFQTTRSLTFGLALAAALLALVEAVFHTSGGATRFARAGPLSAKGNQFASLAVDPDIVVLGNSRVYRGIDTDVIEHEIESAVGRPAHAYNFGRGGLLGQAQLAAVRRILGRKTAPRAVVLFVSPTDFLARDHQPSLTQMVLTSLWKPEDIVSVLRAGASAEDALQILTCALLATLRHRDLVVGHVLRGEPLEYSITGEKGYLPREPVARTKQQRVAQWKADEYRARFRLASGGLSKFKLGAFEEALRQLRAAGVHTWVIEAPSASAVRALEAEKDTVIPAYRRRVRSISELAGVPFIDATQGPQLSDADFADGTHLNRRAAQRYTRFLMRTLIIPGAFAHELGTH